MEFQGRKEANAELPKGKSFLASAKHKHQALFRDYVGLQREFADLQEYTDALQADAWKLSEQIAKQSWKNGVAQGQKRARR
jgi:predicted  nucleic acid-binding Zn-ribbon protein